MKKIIVAISALLLTSSLATVSVSALSFDDLYAWVRSEETSTDNTTETEDTSDTEVSETEETDDTGITTTTVTTTTVTTTVEETDSQTATTTTDGEKEQLKKQIEELERQLEERGMTIDDLSCTIDELQYALTQANNRASNGGGGSGGGGGAAKAPVVTTVTEVTTTETTTVTADTDGNAELIEAVKKEDTERQFITVSAKDGSVFYIVIDHEGGNENVYFLNKVDVADLNAILDPDGENAVTEIVTAPVVTEPVIVEEPVKEENGFLSSISGFLPLLGIGVFALGYYFLKIKPKKNAIPDDDYDGDEDGEDFEQEEEYIEE